jgi:hypothetical protein
MKQVVPTVKYLHENNIVYGHLRPERIMVKIIKKEPEPEGYSDFELDRFIQGPTAYGLKNGGSPLTTTVSDKNSHRSDSDEPKNNNGGGGGGGLLANLMPTVVTDYITGSGSDRGGQTKNNTNGNYAKNNKNHNGAVNGITNDLAQLVLDDIKIESVKFLLSDFQLARTREEVEVDNKEIKRIGAMPATVSSETRRYLPPGLRKAMQSETLWKETVERDIWVRSLGYTK